MSVVEPKSSRNPGVSAPLVFQPRSVGEFLRGDTVFYAVPTDVHNALGRSSSESNPTDGARFDPADAQRQRIVTSMPVEQHVTQSRKLQLLDYSFIAAENSRCAATALTLLNVGRLGVLPLFSRRRSNLELAVDKFQREGTQADELSRSSKPIDVNQTIAELAELGKKYQDLPIVREMFGERPEGADEQLLFDFGVCSLAEAIDENAYNEAVGAYDSDNYTEMVAESAAHTLKSGEPGIASVRAEQLRTWLSTVKVITADLDENQRVVETVEYRDLEGEVSAEPPQTPFKYETVERDSGLYRAGRAEEHTAAREEQVAARAAERAVGAERVPDVLEP